MKKKIIITLLAIVIVFVAYYILNQPRPIARPTENSRTYYQGYVMIEKTSLADIAFALEQNGCLDRTAKESLIGNCYFVYRETSDQAQKNIMVFPRGVGMGPVSFILKEDRLVFDQDIAGKPDKEKCQAEVRRDLKSVGNVVKIQENTWQFDKIEYPWDVIY